MKENTIIIEYGQEDLREILADYLKEKFIEILKED